MNFKPVLHQTRTFLAIAILLFLGGCNVFQTTPETPNPTTKAVDVSADLSNWQKLQSLHNLDVDSTPIVSIAFSPDNTLVATSSFSGQVISQQTLSGNQE